MDDNAQVSAVPTPVSSTSTAADDTSVAVNPVAPQAATRPVEQPNKKQQISAGGHPEQGSVFIGNEEDDEDEEEQQVAKQEIQRKETPIVAQSSHPEVVLPPEVKEVMKEGEDADASKLPEERQKIEEVAVEEQLPAEAAPAPSAPLPLNYQQAVEEKKTTGSPKNSRSWWITEVIREWKKKFERGEES